MNEKYKKQVALLIEILSFISKEECFAIKGGTAINLFYNNLPRLSVDIDLAYINFDERKDAYKKINSALDNISILINKAGYNASLQVTKLEKKLICSNNEVVIKVEPNYIIRGYVYEPKLVKVTDLVEKEYGFAEIKLLSKEEIYGGKICAALDRQHPRDLFDIHQLYKQTGITSKILKGFIAMLLSHPRSIHEILNPRLQDMKLVLINEFQGMTKQRFTYEDHIDVYKKLVSEIRTKLYDYKNFLIDFVKLEHNFSSVNIPNLSVLPAIKWKVKNLEKLKTTNIKKFKEQEYELIKFFEN